MKKWTVICSGVIDWSAFSLDAYAIPPECPHTVVFPFTTCSSARPREATRAGYLNVFQRVVVLLGSFTGAYDSNRFQSECLVEVTG